MRRNFISLLLLAFLSGCALTRAPPPCRGPLQPINTVATETTHGQG